MSRIQGRVENPNFFETPLYFVHDSTTGYSFPPLFQNADAMWQLWDENEHPGDLERAVPAASKSVMVASISFAYGRRFDADGTTFAGPAFGLVTRDRLISSSQFEDRDYSLLDVGGVLHIAEEVEGGYGSQDYHSPLCIEWHKSSDTDRIVPLEEIFDKPLNLCPACVAFVTGASKTGTGV